MSNNKFSYNHLENVFWNRYNRSLHLKGVHYLKWVQVNESKSLVLTFNININPSIGGPYWGKKGGKKKKKKKKSNYCKSLITCYSQINDVANYMIKYYSKLSLFFKKKIVVWNAFLWGVIHQMIDIFSQV